MAKTRYIEKVTGKWYDAYCFHTSYVDGTKEFKIREWDDDTCEYTTISGEEFNERFEFKPFENPSIDVEAVVPRHPIHIVLKCPVCGALLKVKGGAINTSPIQYEHICSNNTCTYGGICTSSYYSGMYAAVTDEQETAIKNGTYKEKEHGGIITLRKENLWKFKD